MNLGKEISETREVLIHGVTDLDAHARDALAVYARCVGRIDGEGQWYGDDGARTEEVTFEEIALDAIYTMEAMRIHAEYFDGLQVQLDGHQRRLGALPLRHRFLIWVCSRLDN